MIIWLFLVSLYETPYIFIWERNGITEAWCADYVEEPRQDLSYSSVVHHMDWPGTEPRSACSVRNVLQHFRAWAVLPCSCGVVFTCLGRAARVALCTSWPAVIYTHAGRCGLFPCQTSDPFPCVALHGKRSSLRDLILSILKTPFRIKCFNRVIQLTAVLGCRNTKNACSNPAPSTHVCVFLCTHWRWQLCSVHHRSPNKP